MLAADCYGLLLESSQGAAQGPVWEIIQTCKLVSSSFKLDSSGAASPSGSMQVSPGENVQLQCTATGEPTPEVTWEKIQGYIPSSPSRGSSVYSMPRVTKENEGSYLCKASSEAGQAEEIVQVIVVEQGNAGDYNR